MSVFVNFKICDNAEECSGVEVCPSGALYWDKDEKTVKSDNSKCISCDVCARACPAGAIYVAHNAKEEMQIKEDIDNDPRTIKDLLVERYGASPVDETLLISVQEAMTKIETVESLLAVEIMDNEDAPCLINSVPISEAFGNTVYEYCKITIGDDEYEAFANKYSIKECPTLLIFKNHSLLTRIDGAVENKDYLQRTNFIHKINTAINS